MVAKHLDIIKKKTTQSPTFDLVPFRDKTSPEAYCGKRMFFESLPEHQTSFHGDLIWEIVVTISGHWRPLTAIDAAIGGH